MYEKDKGARFSPHIRSRSNALSSEPIVIFLAGSLIQDSSLETVDYLGFHETRANHFIYARSANSFSVVPGRLKLMLLPFDSEQCSYEDHVQSGLLTRRFLNDL